MKSVRTHRVAELIQTVIARLLITDISDPRLKFVSITGVDLSPDFKRAIIFFTMPDVENIEAIQKASTAFAKATGFFRLQLSKSIELRHTPQLIFKFDVTVVHAERVSKLLKK